jgi:hypothetical protein
MSGAAFVFVEPLGGWENVTQTAELTVAHGSAGNELGVSVALSGNTIVASSSGLGAVYVFVEPAIGWGDATQTAELTTSDRAYGLGDFVAISGDTVVAGAYGHVTAEGNTSEGAVYVYVEPANGWTNATQTAELTASDGAQSDALGSSGTVAISGDTIIAGSSNHRDGTGAVYVFAEPTTGWANATQNAELTDPGASEHGYLGGSVGIAGDTIVAGALNDGAGRGAVHVFGFGSTTGSSGSTVSGPAPTISNVRTRSDGTISFVAYVPGPGYLDVLETAWTDNFKVTDEVRSHALLQPAAGRFVFARTRQQAAGPGDILIVVKPDTRGMRLVQHHRYPVTLRLWVTYSPTAEGPASSGIYGVGLNLRCAPALQAPAAAGNTPSNHFGCATSPVG